ncbi:hypothetical protein GCM10011586_00140 [Silvibacterium dinghuense]|nr:hypothetical protein GCM10011586_00140 [Silvibacterium dinghuense]
MRQTDPGVGGCAAFHGTGHGSGRAIVPPGGRRESYALMRISSGYTGHATDGRFWQSLLFQPLSFPSLCKHPLPTAISPTRRAAQLSALTAHCRPGSAWSLHGFLQAAEQTPDGAFRLVAVAASVATT